MHRDFRKPLIIMTPKSLLRHKNCVSNLNDFSKQNSFHRFLWDHAIDPKSEGFIKLKKPKKIRKVILCSGKIYFDSYFSLGDLIVLRYISDGLGDNGDFNNVLVPKLAEDAVYSTILYNIAKLRPSAAGALPLYKKEAAAKMRNAKIRLSNMKVKEFAQVLKGKSKWIKH